VTGTFIGVQGPGAPWRVAFAAPSLAPAHLAIVLGMLIEQERPALLQLHGNAVETPGGTLLLVGPSGVGKSTITRELHGRLVSEDLLLVDPAERLLWPFPRASALKGGSQATRLDGIEVDYVGSTGTGSQPRRLDKGVLVLLDRTPTERPALPGTRLGFSHWTPELEVALAPDFVDRRDHSVVARWERALSPEEVAAAAKVALGHSALLLAEPPEALGPVASAPDAQPMPLREAVVALLPHLRTYGLGAMAPGQRAIRLAAALQSLDTWRFRVGGSPAESAQLLRQIAGE